MHYKNGREAHNGDKVMLVPVGYGNPIIGILYDAVAGNDFCNGKIAVMHQSDACPNLKEVLHLDDALAFEALNSEKAEQLLKAQLKIDELQEAVRKVCNERDALLKLVP